MRKIITTAL